MAPATCSLERPPSPPPPMPSPVLLPTSLPSPPPFRLSARHLQPAARSRSPSDLALPRATLVTSRSCSHLARRAAYDENRAAIRSVHARSAAEHTQSRAAPCDATDKDATPLTARPRPRTLSTPSALNAPSGSQARASAPARRSKRSGSPPPPRSLRRSTSPPPPVPAIPRAMLQAVRQTARKGIRHAASIPSLFSHGHAKRSTAAAAPAVPALPPSPKPTTPTTPTSPMSRRITEIVTCYRPDSAGQMHWDFDLSDSSSSSGSSSSDEDDASSSRSSTPTPDRVPMDSHVDREYLRPVVRGVTCAGFMGMGDRTAVAH